MIAQFAMENGPQLEVASKESSTDQTRKRTRRAHHKSRNGCLNCKRLRVKCDEIHPRCTNCVRRKRVCEYAPPKELKNKITSTTPTESADGSSNGHTPQEEPSHTSSNTSSMTLVPPVANGYTALDSAPWTEPKQPPAFYNQFASRQFYSNSRTLPPLVSGGMSGGSMPNLNSSPPALPTSANNPGSNTNGSSGEGSNSSSRSTPGLGNLSPIANNPRSAAANQVVNFPRLTKLLEDGRFECALEDPFDLVLLDYYCEHFAEFVIVREQETSIWGGHVPHLALTSIKKSYGVLALACLHYEYTGHPAPPEHPNLVEYAYSKFTAGMGFYKNMYVAATQEEAEEMFLFSVFVQILAYQFFDTLPLIANDVHGMDIVSITRGPMLVLLNNLALIQTNPRLSPLMWADFERPNAYDNVRTVLNLLDEAVDILDAKGYMRPETDTLHYDETNNTNSAAPANESRATIYHRAIDDMRLGLLYGITRGYVASALFWQMKIEYDFLSLARSRALFAKVLQAFYLVCLHSIRNMFWVDNLAQRLMTLIEADLSGHEPWCSMVQWPKKMIFDTPKDLCFSTLWQFFTSDLDNVLDLSHL
ncbi:hypothetical protein TRVA0_014S00540 [Trichomonascus vanleenenianus]|uniref:Zn(II)2Cys6 transcription factor domain-containing protein n=1 Tax=Trichomonascus vanleenenianus TaxID=2268995 RepID=UPI003ECA58B4